jgi:hypothetical protein
MQIEMFYLPTFMGMLIQFFADYIKHRLTAKSRHGTHSPFVYKLVDEVIYDFSIKKVYEDLEKQRKKLLNDGKVSLSPRLAQLLYRLANNHPPLSPQLDFVYVNGDRTKETTLNYFYTYLLKVHEGSLLVFNDIYRNKGMKVAWEEIKSHPQVTVTIDLFWMGLVYFKKDQVKEHFKIKF